MVIETSLHYDAWLERQQIVTILFCGYVTYAIYEAPGNVET